MFLVGVTRDFLRPDGTPGFGDIGLPLLERGGVAWEYLPAAAGELPPEAARDYDGLLVLAPRVSAATLAGTDLVPIVRPPVADYHHLALFLGSGCASFSWTRSSTFSPILRSCEAITNSPPNCSIKPTYHARPIKARTYIPTTRF